MTVVLEGELVVEGLLEVGVELDGAEELNVLLRVEVQVLVRLFLQLIGALVGPLRDQVPVDVLDLLGIELFTFPPGEFLIPLL